MPWGRLDDSLYDHPKVEALPAGVRLACVGLWTMAISYSNRHLTDGRVTTARIHKMGGTERHVRALVDVGLFEACGDGILVHDFDQYNETRERTLDRRDRMAEIGKRGGQRSGEARRTKRDASTSAKRDAGSTVEHPSHTHTHTQNVEKNEGYTATPGAVARANGRVDPEGILS